MGPAGGWQASFVTLAGLSALTALGLFAIRHRIPHVEPRREGGGYRALFFKRPYVRHTLAHGFRAQKKGLVQPTRAQQTVGEHMPAFGIRA